MHTNTHILTCIDNTVLKWHVLQAFAEPSQQAETGADHQDGSGPASTSKEHFDPGAAQDKSGQQPATTGTQAAVPASAGQGGTAVMGAQQADLSASEQTDPGTLASNAHRDGLVAERMPSTSSGGQDGKLMSLLMD